jgi:hypothetical protein
MPNSYLLPSPPTPTAFLNGIQAGGITIAPSVIQNQNSPAFPGSLSPTIITFADGSTQATSAVGIAAMMAVIFASG